MYNYKVVTVTTTTPIFITLNFNRFPKKLYLFVLSWSHFDDFYCDEIQVYQDHVEQIVLVIVTTKINIFVLVYFEFSF